MSFDPLPAGEVVAMKLCEFRDRASYDPDDTLEGHRVRLVGFATPSEDAPGGPSPAR